MNLKPGSTDAISLVEKFDARSCALGEGPLWHPERQQLFWFDIIGKRLLSQVAGRALSWDFNEPVSAAAWTSRDELLIASQSQLMLFNLETGLAQHLCPLEAHNPTTRSNDGRADPWGGFWIGTMGLEAQAGAGALYRYFEGRLVQIRANMTIPNAICFSPDGRYVYFTDTPSACIYRQALDGQGWPKGSIENFIDLSEDLSQGRPRCNPDGAVVDANGNLWNAHWGASHVSVYNPNGIRQSTYTFPAVHTSCPAFGGADLSTLYVTSATQGLRAPDADQGCTFALAVQARGQREHRVVIVAPTLQNRRV